jgi:hypothetical protein
MVSGQLEGCLYGFGARVAQEQPLWAGTRRQRGKASGQLNVQRLIVISPADVEQTPCLLLDGLNHPWMAVACRADSNASSAIQEAIAIQIFNHHPLGPLDRQGIGPGQ